jgi:hypothetical protein
MMYERLDKSGKAQVLSVIGDEVMFTATWPSTDARRFPITDGVARNTVCVSQAYFERKYGVVL